MPKITSIKPQKSKKRVNIYLDNKFGFGLDLENFVKLRLKVEQELNDEEIANIVKKSEFQKTLDKLLNFAMIRPRSEKEFADWMRRKKVNESIVSDLFNKLNYFELIDDLKFAKWWVNQRLEFRKKSKKTLIGELRLKGIKSEIINSIFDDIEIDDKKLASSVLEKKYYRWEKLPIEERKKKMAEYLLRNGFNWDDARSVIDDLLSKR